MEITPINPAATDADILQALEKAAAEIRSRGQVVQTAAPASAPPTSPAPPAEGLNTFSSDSEDRIIPGEASWLPILLPNTLLWSPPIANLLEPRSYVKFSSYNKQPFIPSTIDTSIGGTMPLSRYGTCGPAPEGMQVDVFAVVQSRFANNNTNVANDFRFGFPITFAWGDGWSSKIGYEHTSTHLGDDFVARSGRFKDGHLRDEIVLGLSYLAFDQLRFYGQVGLAFHLSTPGGANNQADRYDLGIEWIGREPTGLRGAPYAAFDLDLRGDENHTANVTLQAGWRWLGSDSRARFRAYAEYRHGNSPFGQFYLEKQHWIAGGLAIDY